MYLLIKRYIKVKRGISMKRVVVIALMLICVVGCLSGCEFDKDRATAKEVALSYLKENYPDDSFKYIEMSGKWMINSDYIVKVYSYNFDRDFTVKLSGDDLTVLYQDYYIYLTADEATKYFTKAVKGTENVCLKAKVCDWDVSYVVKNPKVAFKDLLSESSAIYQVDVFLPLGKGNDANSIADELTNLSKGEVKGNIIANFYCVPNYEYYNSVTIVENEKELDRLGSYSICDGKANFTK